MKKIVSYLENISRYTKVSMIPYVASLGVDLLILQRSNLDFTGFAGLTTRHI
jgi:hypothetical protein